MGIVTLMLNSVLNPAIGYLTIVTSIVILLALILIMVCTSKWGLFLFFAAKLISGITASAILGPDGQNEVMRAIMACVILGVVLFLRKDGVSGWSVLLKKRAMK